MSARICLKGAACTEGTGFARGAQVGEHAYVTYAALELAGLKAFADDSTPIFDVFTDAQTIAGTTVTSVAPAAPQSVAARASRVVNGLHELAEVADGSYSLSDYLLGNEHCFANDAFEDDAQGKAVWRDSLPRVDACHTFSSHMGSVNSTHFVPQAGTVYGHYHGLAMETARRCAQLRTTFEAATAHGLGAAMQGHWLACEREALAFQAVAAHFLGDAWSLGHMWQRWGRPNFPNGPENRLRAQVTSMAAGVIHGWRSVVADYLNRSAQLKPLVHDQMCMPGFSKPVPIEDESKHRGELVEWSDGTNVSAGGGDLYLLKCNGRDQDGRWAVAGGNGAGPQPDEPLFRQWNRATSCIAHGFREVYEAGPKSAGALPAMAGDSEISGSADPDCWSARATNKAMLLGAGGGDWGVFYDPASAGKVVVTALPTAGAGLGGLYVTPEQLERVTEQFQYASMQLGLELARRAAADPDNTTSAELSHPKLRSFLGQPRNEDGQADFLVGDVTYLEPRLRSAWTTAAQGTCSKDADCADDAYCDKTASAPVCRRQEAAILRAFRVAEVAYHCANDTPADLDAARARCAAASLATDDRCDACVQMVLPHVRNACDADSYVPQSNGADRRSLCDVLKGSPLLAASTDLETTSVYRAYDKAFLDSATNTGPEKVARELCRMPLLPMTRVSTAAPPALPDSLLSMTSMICARTCGESCLWCWPGGNATCGKVSSSATPAPACFPVESTTAGIHQQARVVSADGTCAVTQDGKALCKEGGMLRTVAATGALEYARGDASCARMTDGTTLCWVAGAAADTRKVKYLPTDPGPPVAITDAEQIASSNYYVMTRTTSGAVFQGYSRAGYYPTTGPFVPFSGVSEVAGGGYYCMRMGGSVTCIHSSNSFGERGDGTFQPPAPGVAPTPVSGLSDATTIAVGESHACAVRTGGTVVCWGKNDLGQLGDGNTNNAATPVAVSGLTGATALAINVNTSCALKSDHTVWCWGSNLSSALGDPAFTAGSSTTPRKVPLPAPSCP